MKRLLLLILLLLASRVSGQGGELIFNFDGSLPSDYTYELGLSASGYVWGYDKVSEVTIPMEGDSRNFSGRIIRFTGPRSGGTAPTPIYWGLYDVSLAVYGTINNVKTLIYPFHFRLDLRDFNWSIRGTAENGNPYIGADLDVTAKAIDSPPYVGLELTAVGFDDYQKTVSILNNSTYEAWTMFGVDAPDMSMFRYPVQLMNREEGGAAGFGYLVSGGRQITSDQFDNFMKDVNNSVTHGTTERINNGRKYSFRWENIEIEQTLSSIYSSQNDFKITNGDVKDRQVIRYFRNVYPLTVKNLLPELGTQSYGTVMFKDPTTTNSPEEKLAEGSGFVKNEAFERLF